MGPAGAGLGAGLGAADGASSSDGEEEEGEAALSKRAAKKQRKKELSEADAIAETPISSGFGHAMLLKMGWGGQGSGLREGGIAEPVKALAPAGKRGLTAEDDEQLSLSGGGDGGSGDGGGGGGTEPSVAEVGAKAAEGGKAAKAEGGKTAKRARADKGLAASRSWHVELELSTPTDEATIRTALLAVPNVLWVPRLSAE